MRIDLHRDPDVFDLTLMSLLRYGNQPAQSLQIIRGQRSTASMAQAIGAERGMLSAGAAADHIAVKYPTDPETGYPVGVSAEDTETVRPSFLLAPEAPPPTVEDAKRLYLKDRFANNRPTPLAKKRDEQRADRATGHIVTALGRVPTIASLQRSDARAVQTHMLGVINSPDTVERYLNDARAIISHSIKEFDLTGVINPFIGHGEAEWTVRRDNGRGPPLVSFTWRHTLANAVALRFRRPTRS